MKNKQTKPSKIAGTIDTISELSKALPIYPDAIQPAAKQVGQTLELAAKSVNIALAPIKVMVWSYDRIEKFISESVARKLEKTPQDRIITPAPEVAGPVLNALVFSGENVNLRELYSNLLATAMDQQTQQQAHPSFVEIIKNLTSDEAKLIRAFLHSDSFPVIDVSVFIQTGD